MKSILFARKINPNDDHIQIAHWHIQNHTFVRKGQDLLDVSTSKVSVTLTSEHEGYLHQLKSAGKKVKVGDPFAEIYSSLEEIPQSGPTEKFKSTGENHSYQNFNFERFSDAAMSLITEHSLDQSLFKGMGLVTATMVNAKVQELTEKKSALLPQIPSHPFRVQETFGPKEMEIQQLLQGQRGLINSHLTVQFLAAPLLKKLENTSQGQTSLLPLILHEFSQLLKAHPSFTAFYSDQKIHFYDEITLGLALDTGKGLKVASTPRASNLTPTQWKERITDLAMKDLRGQLTLEDLQPTTVTVTDLSSLDILHFQPLINGAQSCILGVGGDRTLEGHPMTLTMNFDHRVLTGREVGEFLNQLKNKILSYQNL